MSNKITGLHLIILGDLHNGNLPDIYWNSGLTNSELKVLG